MGLQRQERKGKNRTRRKKDLLALSSLSSKDLPKIRRCPVASPNPGSPALHPETSPCPHQRCKKKKRLSQLEILGTSPAGTSKTFLSFTPSNVHLTGGNTDMGTEGRQPRVAPTLLLRQRGRGTHCGAALHHDPCCLLNILS